MDDATLQELRELLHARRRDLVRQRRGQSRELEAIKSQERFPEIEENAQAASAEYVLTQLSDSARREVGQVDAALARMEAGTYGVCLECEEDIPVERLRAMPYALRDADCEGRREADELSMLELPSL